MTDWSRTFVVAAGLALLFAGCSDELPPLPDSSVQKDGAVHDSEPVPDGVLPIDSGPPICVDNGGCPPQAYCALPQSEGCEGQGRCQPRPVDCPASYAPVCGCDGVTYSNGCMAAAAGVNVAEQGECAITPCMGPVDCTDSQFCNLDEHCGAQGMSGLCEPLPGPCPEVVAPVCGCDHKTHPTACDAHNVGVSVWFQGSCESVDPAYCEEVENAYVSALSDAQSCTDPNGSGDMACDKEVMDKLSCPCPTFVASGNTRPIGELDDMLSKWTNGGCDKLVGFCPPCARPGGAACDTSTGRCVDQP